MPRPINPAADPRELDAEVGIFLIVGPPKGCGYSSEQLAASWAYHGPALLDDCGAALGWRPWAWWRFTAGEEQPPTREAETLRLAELGELHAEEIASLRERAAEACARLQRREHALADVAGIVALVDAVEAQGFGRAGPGARAG